MSWLVFVLLIPPTLLAVIRPADAVEGPIVRVHTGICEASAAVPLRAEDVEGPFLVASDEDNTLRAYAAADGGPLALARGDLGSFLGLNVGADEDDKADLEAAATIGDRTYWIASHSRSAKGNARKSRWQLFTTTAHVRGLGYEIETIGVHHPSRLLEAFRGIPELDTAIGNLDLRVEQLAPEKAGFNIEGLATGPANRLLIGLRNPRHGSDAIIVPLLNPQAIVDTGAAPQLGDPVYLDLDGRGIRSLERADAADVYFVVAGPSGSRGPFAVYTWDGVGGKPESLTEVTAWLEERWRNQDTFNPEAIIVAPDGSSILLISDEGDRTLEQGGVEIACKDAPDDVRSFRSALFKLQVEDD